MSYESMDPKLRETIHDWLEIPGKVSLFETIEEFLAEVKAEAWDEGHRTYQKRGPDACTCSAWSAGECACGLYGTGKIVTPNPYRRTE